MHWKIGVVIPCFNNLQVVKRSLTAVYNADLLIVLFDDGSTDGTAHWVSENFPSVKILTGDGTNWWAGSLKKGMEFCLRSGCEYIVSLNADVLISPEIVFRLVKTSKENSNAIVASVVVDVNDITRVLWAGSVFKKLHPFLPVYSCRYLFRSGELVSSVPNKIYPVDEVHGRGVVIPAAVLSLIGSYDAETFPQYGGDTEFSLRARSHNVELLVNPDCIARGFSENTSLNKPESLTFMEKIVSIKRYLLDRKYGEALFVWWNIYRRHLPLRYFIQSYFFVISLNVYRKILS